jgi:DNA-binding beta-propeller fold protein YncE
MADDARAADEESLPGAAGAPAARAPIGECCKVAPPVLVFNAAGDLVSSWGGPGQGFDWPDSNHGITVDHERNVWLAGNGERDTQILKFTREGRFLLQIGTHGVHKGSNDVANFWKPTKIADDPAAGEIYVADGYGNRRVIVFDARTGAYKRHWGAYGAVPNDDKVPPYNPAAPPSKQFSTVHCVAIAADGLVYVCDRVNDRIQVFRKDGTFVKEARVEPDTYRSGSVWDVALSRDPAQAYLFVANGVNERVNILDRDTLEVVTSFGDGGRQPGQFFGVHNLATDSKGNLYTAETYTGARVQRFLYKGIGPVPAGAQGVAWPTAATNDR